VHTSSGDYLGETPFEYFDEIKDTLQLVIRNDRLRALFFRLMAQDLENKSSETLSKETLISSSFKITGKAIDKLLGSLFCWPFV